MQGIIDIIYCGHAMARLGSNNYDNMWCSQVRVVGLLELRVRDALMVLGTQRRRIVMTAVLQHQLDTN